MSYTRERAGLPEVPHPLITDRVLAAGPNELRRSGNCILKMQVEGLKV
jgi:hypothetical protein